MIASKGFQYSDELVKWVNENIEPEQVISITSKGQFCGEGYMLFYIKITNGKYIK